MIEYGVLREKRSQEPLSYHTNRLDHIRRRMINQIRAPYLLMTPPERQALITDNMNNLIGVPSFVTEFIHKQGGSEMWLISGDDKRDLPPQAIARWERSYEDRSAVLWPWLLFNESNEQMRKDYMDNYLQAAKIVGSFPFTPTFEAVASQREIDWKYRLLAAQIMFYESCIIYPDLKVAASPILSMIGYAMDEYKKKDVIELQAMVKRKAPRLTDDSTNPFIEHRMWDNPESLSLMCVDRALRDLIVNHYGLFRGVTLPNASGYQTGQRALAFGVVADRVLSVAN